ncbi:MAG: DsbA family protein [Phycisphaerae bacterium]|nr:DsbA family protein [Phycisphaerae bacterium]
MSKTRLYPGLLLAVVLALGMTGAWISGQLVKQHAGVWADSGGRTSFFFTVCHVAEKAGFGCAESTKGGWSEIAVPVPRPSRYQGLVIRPARVPVAFLGLAYFVSMVVWFGLVGGPREASYPWRYIPLAAAGAGGLASVFLVGLMVVGQAPWCVWCLATHIVNLAMVLCIWRLSCGAAVWAPVTHREAVGAVAVSLVLLGGLWVYRSDQLAMHDHLRKVLPFKQVVKSMREDPAFLRREHFAKDPVDIPGRQRQPARGGRAQLVVFNDYQCPKCAWVSSASIQQAIRAFDGRLDVIVRQYPLCQTCNPNVVSEFHAKACEAAQAAEAARLQGGDGTFWRMHELLHANVDRLGVDLYRRLAGQLGLDADRLVADMDSPAVRQVISEDIEAGKRAGVVGTPTLFLNGRPVNLVFGGPTFWQAMAEAWVGPSGMQHVLRSATPDLSVVMSLDSTEE